MKTETCWLWTAPLSKHGYGRMMHGGRRSARAHRISWEMHNGPIPAGMFVCHKCDVRNCVNPDHLFIGTNADNMADMRAKGRGVGKKGSAHSLAKLTEEDVVRMRAAHAEGSQAPELAKTFGVCRGTVRRIVTGKIWRHVQQEHSK